MDKNTALFLLDDSSKTSLVDIMKGVNDILKQNNADVREYFSQQDINFAELFIKLSLNERERDIMYLSNFFHKAYSLLNVDVMILKDDLNKDEQTIVNEVFNRLKKYNLEYLLVQDVPVETLKRVMYVNP